MAITDFLSPLRDVNAACKANTPVDEKNIMKTRLRPKPATRVPNNSPVPTETDDADEDYTYDEAEKQEDDAHLSTEAKEWTRGAKAAKPVETTPAKPAVEPAPAEPVVEEAPEVTNPYAALAAVTRTRLAREAAESPEEPTFSEVATSEAAPEEADAPAAEEFHGNTMIMPGRRR